MPGADELPEQIATWQPDPARAVLLIHDMQKYFLRPFPQGGSPLTEMTSNIIRLRRACTRTGTPVAYTMQPGGMTPRQRGLLVDFWGPGMTIDAAHREVTDGLTRSRTIGSSPSGATAPSTRPTCWSGCGGPGAINFSSAACTHTWESS